MSELGTLLYCEEAKLFIDSIPDPVTRSLVNMAFVQFVKIVYIDKSELPRGDIDMLFVAKTLQHFFAEHEVIARTLEGDKVGAWFEGEGT